MPVSDLHYRIRVLEGRITQAKDDKRRLIKEREDLETALEGYKKNQRSFQEAGRKGRLGVQNVQQNLHCRLAQGYLMALEQHIDHNPYSAADSSFVQIISTLQIRRQKAATEIKDYINSIAGWENEIAQLRRQIAVMQATGGC